MDTDICPICGRDKSGRDKSSDGLAALIVIGVLAATVGVGLNWGTGYGLITLALLCFVIVAIAVWEIHHRKP